MKQELNINEYTYDLPPDRIALYPLEKRDTSKLLVYQNKKISHSQFKQLPDYLPDNSFLFFNDTKVIPARLHFKKETGAEIEIFILHPLEPSTLLVETMEAHPSCTWKCTIGNLKRWTEGKSLVKKINDTSLEASLINREEGVVTFTWNTQQSFAEIINLSGETPLPPYLKRKAETTDRDRYQTVYAHYEGAVAAPTAGLHFTPEVLETLRKKNIEIDFLTLHVSAGTFQPVKVQNATEHTMHQEQILVSRNNIENLLNEEKIIVPVGTTSMRTLESLYWYGVKLIENADAPFTITQHDPYVHRSNLPTGQQALKTVLAYMDKKQKDLLTGETSIYIMPGYEFKLCKALITNFHQPGSTLILLVAAFAGSDWKKIYNEALANGYRFLSYGDSSLLFPGSTS